MREQDRLPKSNKNEAAKSTYFLHREPSRDVRNGGLGVGLRPPQYSNRGEKPRTNGEQGKLEDYVLRFSREMAQC